MCISPIKIRNPNYGCTAPLVQKTTDTVSRYIKVPCNSCCECLAKRQAQFVQRCRLESLTHHLFFATLTYQDQYLPYIDTSTGYRIKYADIHDVQCAIKRIRKANSFGRPFMYFAVSERGGERGRPHFHILFFIDKEPKDDFFTCMALERKCSKVLFKEWRRNIGTTFRPVWVPLSKYVTKYQFGRITSTYDFHFVNPSTTIEGVSNVAYYVSKYMLKPSDRERKLHSALRFNLDPDEYDSVWNLVKSKCFKSLNFGCSSSVQVANVKAAISQTRSSSDGFRIVNPINGFPEPLSKYYRKFVTADDAISSVAARGGPLAYRDRSLTEIDRNIYNFNKRKEMIESHEQSSFFPHA